MSPYRTRACSLLLILLSANLAAAGDFFQGPLETIWEEGGFTEGAAAAPNGDMYFSDFAQPFNARPARIMRYRPSDGKVVVHCGDSKMANGLMFDRKGVLYACCASPLGGQRALVRITPDGKVKPVVERFQGKRFNSPNDIVIDRKGRIYFSDPKYVGPEEMELDSMDVYRLDPDGALHRATTNIDKPNGVMLSPDGRTFYVAETDNGTDKADIVSESKQGRMTLNAFDVDGKGILSNKRVLVDFGDQVGVDGMTVDSKGNLYAAVRSADRFGIYVFSPKGKELDYLKTPELPTNCCFGVGDDDSTLYITAGKGFYKVPVKADGHHPAVAAAPVLDATQVARLLREQIIDASIPQQQVEDFCDARVPVMPEIEFAQQWNELAETLRKRVLKEVVFRGEAVNWRKQPPQVEMLDELAGGEGYTIRKLRFQALPGLWIPALLYMPDKLDGPAPAVMNVNGHDRASGKAAKYKQLRCINQAKRGMIALNVEWLGMGQLQSPGNRHYRMNQLDLCGTSGLSPFYLAMERGLDLLLSLKETDPERLAVAGLSGGGWQTIIISSLDTRVTLCNPVAGYSSFRTRIDNHSDLGDSEQTPCDLATVVDYTHLTAMLAPRAALLTFNVKDNCCFASTHALPPLMAAARPAYAANDAAGKLSFHVNEDPGTHNFERDNRQALYRAFKQHFFLNDAEFPTKEIDVSGELKTIQQLTVPLPKDNATLQSIALGLSKQLPQFESPLAGEMDIQRWSRNQRNALRRAVRFPSLRCDAKPNRRVRKDGVTVTHWRLHLRRPGGTSSSSPIWTVPATEFAPQGFTQSVMVLGDAGRKELSQQVQEHLEQNRRVLAIDPFYLGESKIRSRDFLFGLLVSAVGERPIGIQAGQIAAISNWLSARGGEKPIAVAAYGPRTSTMALIAAAIEPRTIGQVDLHNALGSLKESIEREWDAQKTPEMFCFGLLQRFDIAQMVALCGSRTVRFMSPSARVKAEMASASALFEAVGANVKY